MQAHRLAGILGIARYENNIHLRVDFLQTPCQLNAVHSSHMNVQKGNIAAFLPGSLEQIVLIVKG